MPARIAIHAAALSGATLDELIPQTKSAAADGLELTAIHGSLDIGAIHQLAQAPAHVARLLSAADLQLAVLDPDLSVGALSASRLPHWLKLVERWITLAAAFEKPALLFRADSLAAGLNRDTLIRQAVDALARLSRIAEQAKVTLLFENSGVAANSRETWFLHDVVGSPALRVCWNTALRLPGSQPLDPPSVALKRLAAPLAAVRLPLDRVILEAAGNRRDERGVFDPPPVRPDPVDVLHVVELLRGIAFDGWILLTPPARDATSVSKADPSAAAAYVRAQFTKPVVQMSAYKGDKNAPRYPRAVAPT